MAIFMMKALRKCLYAGLSSDILVAPVLYENVNERKVYLPAGSWISLNDSSVHEGGKEITATSPIDSIPVFVREGNLNHLSQIIREMSSP